MDDHFDNQQKQIDFGMYDAKGREVGARIRTWREVGERPFVMFVSATRNGLYFGATQSSRHFTTESERDMAVEMYLKGARRRAASK
jgi:hypothetical protein